ncbi:plasmid mobilization protein [Zophobihabitans entericus]|uniref:Conjugal transfer protein TrbJ n=1 Tax=Zophobihabitans entericus TaxID=1635327 RepID=A0A6G9IE71_9GAMM|nr:conjugal transfer protein TrbJ [Zophobihabitans entericus]QIQ22533.1 conjugal transfer protein TrbJ [Zophobihabitans entericus]
MKKSINARRNTTPIKVWVFPDEKEIITNNAKQHGLKNSAFLRSLGLNIVVNGVIDQQAVIDIVKVNADLGRLGGLLKLWLTKDEKLKSWDKDSIEKLLDEISRTQELLYQKVSKF